MMLAVDAAVHSINALKVIVYCLTILFLQVNLDFNTTHIISQSLQRPSAACFVVAQRKIFSLMENGSFPRFLQSEQYRGLFHAGSGGRGKHRKVFRTKSAEGVIERGPKTIILS